jgi:hypothetical protein
MIRPLITERIRIITPNILFEPPFGMILVPYEANIGKKMKAKVMKKERIEFWIHDF